MRRNCLTDSVWCIAKESKICIELLPLWDKGEAALELRDPHPRRATLG